MRFTSHFWRRLVSAFLVVSFCTVNPVAAADPGDPDPDFGSGGAVVMDVGADNFGDNARHVAVQCDGRIVVTGDSGYTVARFNADGTPDADFGTAGFVLLTANGETVSGHMSVIQRDGKIVVFGDRWNTNDPVAVRLNSDGSTDTSYGNNGVVSLDVDPGDENLWASALQTDDKILVASNLRFLVLRLSKDGALDPSFGSGGVATGAGPGFNAIKLQADGKIVGVGGFSGPFMIARLNSNGSFDASFDTDGIVATDVIGVNGAPTGVAVRSDGKIVVGGYGSVTGSPDPYREIILLRFGSNGALDTSFGNAGVVATDIAPTDDEIYDLVLDPQERILITGQAEGYSATGASVLIVRYTAEGLIDTSFGANGAVVGDGTAWALTLQTDGKIVIGGYRGEIQRQFLVQRFLNDPASAGVVPAYCQASSGSSGSGGNSSNNNNSDGGGGGGGSIDLFSLALAISLLAIGGVRRRRSR